MNFTNLDFRAMLDWTAAIWIGRKNKFPLTIFKLFIWILLFIPAICKQIVCSLDKHWDSVEINLTEVSIQVQLSCSRCPLFTPYAVIWINVDAKCLVSSRKFINPSFTFTNSLLQLVNFAIPT